MYIYVCVVSCVLLSLVLVSLFLLGVLLLETRKLTFLSFCNCPEPSALCNIIIYVRQYSALTAKNKLT